MRATVTDKAGRRIHVYRDFHGDWCYAVTVAGGVIGSNGPRTADQAIEGALTNLAAYDAKRAQRQAKRDAYGLYCNQMRERAQVEGWR
jgi:hypothetical protein